MVADATDRRHRARPPRHPGGGVSRARDPGPGRLRRHAGAERRARPRRGRARRRRRRQRRRRDPSGARRQGDRLRTTSSADEQEPYDDLGHGTWVAGHHRRPQVRPARRRRRARGEDRRRRRWSTRTAAAASPQIADGIDWAVDHRASSASTSSTSRSATPHRRAPRSTPPRRPSSDAVARGHHRRRGGREPARPRQHRVARQRGARRSRSARWPTSSRPPTSAGPGSRRSSSRSGGPTAAWRHQARRHGRRRPHIAAIARHPRGAPRARGPAARRRSRAASRLLMLDANPTLTPAARQGQRDGHGRGLGPPGPDEDYGAGRLDAYAALHAAGAPLADAARRARPPARSPAAPRTPSRGRTRRRDGRRDCRRRPLVADAGARLPATAAADLDLRLRDPAALTSPRRSTAAAARSLALPPPPGTYTLDVTGAPGAPTPTSRRLGRARRGDAHAPALTLETPAAATNDPTPRFDGGTPARSA